MDSRTPAPASLPDHDEALARALLDAGAADAEALARARAVAERENARLDRVLLRLGLVDEVDLLPTLCRVLGLPFLPSPVGERTDPDLIRALTPGYLGARLAAPLASDGPEVAFALTDPGDAALLAELAFLTDRPVRAAGATTSVVRSLLARPADDPERTAAEREAQASRDQSRLKETAADGPVIRYVLEKLTDAVQQGASDVHFECAEQGLGIRFRIHGALIPQRTDPAMPAAAVLARLKVMASVNVAERRLPQDGRFTETIAGRVIDFRFSSLPTFWGESIVCRTLDPRALRLGWDQLGFPAETAAAVCRIIEEPSGLFLVTGPTGSGKTTTLYTALAHLNTRARKIVTVEDPVEYSLPGIQQVQVHEAIGLTFARVLRGVLRHDPNVILVGEIRDEETAEIACRAAQVGRMVLSTLHANSAEGAVTRLVDLRVPEFVVREVLRGVLAQDLVGVWCRACLDEGCGACAGREREGAPVGRRLRVALRVG